MTIEFVGNTLADFLADVSGAGMEHYSSEGSDRYDETRVPNALYVPIDANGTSPFTIYTEAEAADCWVHFQYRNPEMYANGAGGALIWVYDESDNILGGIDAISDSLRAYANGDSAQYGLQSAMASLEFQTIDLHVEVDASNITVTLYKNGSQISTAVSSNTGGKGGVKRIFFVNDDMSYYDGSSSYFSEFIVTGGGESTLGWRLSCIEPTGEGNYTDWDGGFAQLANPDIAVSAGASADGERVSSTVTYNGEATPAGIRAVILKTLVSKGDVGPGTVKPFLRIGATDYEGASQPVTTNMDSYDEVWENNPATSAAWDTADIASLEIGIKAET